jgi:hypothetical protein
MAWDRMPLGLKNNLSQSAARRALASRRDRKRWNLQKRKVPALHRAAERDTTGSNGRQQSLHTRIDDPAQGSVACLPHLPLLFGLPY